MLTKVKACANLFVPLIGVVASVLFMGCSSLRLRKKYHENNRWKEVNLSRSLVKFVDFFVKLSRT